MMSDVNPLDIPSEKANWGDLSQYRRLLVWGGVYGNIGALQACLKMAEKYEIPAGAILNSGDTVAYCSAPEACVKKIQDLNIKSIAGNVERRLPQGDSQCGFDTPHG